MTISRSCSWCHKINALTVTGPSFCEQCEHRADLPRMNCDCPKCRRTESPKDASGNRIAVGSLVEFLEAYQGFAGGKVVAIIRGVLGPIAGVEVETGRTVDTLCRHLRKV